MSDFCLVTGFALAITGIYLVAGAGWSCLAAGTVLFVAGGLAARNRRHR